ncbi:MAG: hypothetical protein MUP09_06715 [Thiovulaceae bacterium]|nr:hypothetical protein [Sulfurimonadaceae bacterium]
MRPNTDQSKAPQTKDHLKALPMTELQKKLDTSPQGISQEVRSNGTGIIGVAAVFGTQAVC